MPGEAVPIGPFTGGINLNEDPSLIADNQAYQIVNFDIGRAGELTVRPGLKEINAFGVAGTTRILGTVTKADGSYRTYLRSGTSLYYTDNHGVGIIGFGTDAAKYPQTVIQYVESPTVTTPYAYFIPHGANSADPTSGYRQNLSTFATSTIGGMPRGSAGIIFRERLFIFGPEYSGHVGTFRIWYSNSKDFTTFGVNSFVDVGAGDGEYVTAMAIQNDSLIIFKNNSTWIYTFEADPALGTLRKFNTEIGATSPNSVISYENQLYVIHQRGIFRMINYLFESISDPLGSLGNRSNNLNKDSITVLNSKLLFVLDLSGAGKAYYVYYPELNAWSEYRFTASPERFVSTGKLSYEIFLAYKPNSTTVYSFKPFDTALSNYGDYLYGTFTHLLTKRYSFNTTVFKRMFWWAVEAFGRQGTFETKVITETVNGATATHTPTTLTKTFKQYIATRFRTVQFEIKGTTASTPVFTISSVTAFLSEKAKVSASGTP